MTTSLSLEPLLIAGVRFDVDESNNVVILSQPPDETDKSEPLPQAHVIQSDIPKNTPITNSVDSLQSPPPILQQSGYSSFVSETVPQFFKCLPLY